MKFYTIFLLLFSQIILSQTPLWIDTMGGTDNDKALALATDSQNNVLVTGSFHNTVDFDPGAGVYDLASNGNEDIFVQKLDTNGQLLWVKQIGGTGTEVGFSIAVDDNDNIYILGGFSETSDFDPGISTQNLTSLGSWDTFLLKLDAQGNFVWVKQIGNANLDYAPALALDHSGHILVTGIFKNTVYFDPPANTLQLTSNGGWDFYVAQFDIDGNYIWAQNFGGTSYDKARYIYVDDNDFVYITGQYRNTVDFDNSNNTAELTAIDGYDGFVLKLNNQGDFVWVKQWGGAGQDEVRGLDMDANQNIYITGKFYDNVDMDPGTGTYNLNAGGNTDTFIVKLDSNADFVWAKSIDNDDTNIGYTIQATENGRVYIGGYFEGDIVYTWDAGFVNFTSNGDKDAYILTLNAIDGSYDSFYQAGGSGEDQIYTLCYNHPNSLYASGSFSGTADFGTNGNQNLRNSNGGLDAFVLKIDTNTNSTGAIDFFKNLRVYPNPVTDKLYIDFGDIKEARIKLIDLKGSVLWAQDKNPLQSNTAITAPAQGGIYFLEIQSQGYIFRQKILVP